MVRCSLAMEVMGVCKENPMRIENDRRGCTLNTLSERAQWSWFPKKPTSDKYSTSECLQGRSSLVSAASHVFTNICRFPPMRPKIVLRTSHGKRLGPGSGWNTIPARRGFHSKKMAEADIFNATQGALSTQRGPNEVSGTLERSAHTKRELNWLISQAS